jgi:hypothetical protein
MGGCGHGLRRLLTAIDRQQAGLRLSASRLDYQDIKLGARRDLHLRRQSDLGRPVGRADLDQQAGRLFGRAGIGRKGRGQYLRDQRGQRRVGRQFGQNLGQRLG